MPQRSKSTVSRAEADKIAGLVAFDAMLDLVNNKRKFFILNFMAGLWRGVGSIVGVALVIVIIGYIVSLLGGIPWIGSFIREVQQNIPS